MPPHPQSADPAAAPAARSSIALPNTDTQRVANANVSHSISLHIDKNPEDDCEEIIASTRAINTKRWVSADLAQPDTVDFWVRISKDHTQRIAMFARSTDDEAQIFRPVHHAGALSIDRERGLGRHHPPLEVFG